MTETNNKMQTWVEKYRPSNVKDIILPSRIMENLENALNNIRNSSNQLPNLILHSQSAGTGKTTSALAICNELGYEALIINGSSDGRLIDTLRTTVTDYCLRPDLFGGNTKRAVIFDEADMMPKDTVQSALRTMTEQFSDRNNILFIMTCNNINNIIHPLLSRSTTIDFTIHSTEYGEITNLFTKRMQHIFEQEKVENIENCMDYVKDHVANYLPDMRSFINHIQFWITSAKEYDKPETEGNSSSVAVNQLIDLVNDGNLNNAIKLVRSEMRNMPIGNLANILVEIALEQERHDVILKIADCIMNEYRVSNIDTLKVAMISAFSLSKPTTKGKK